MTCYLLDVNVLIALIDPVHLQHDRTHTWFKAIGSKSCATYPITENGLLRIVGHPRYPNSPGSPVVVVEMLAGLRGLLGHSFWTDDDLSIFEYPGIDSTRILTSTQINDTYLLGLAKANGGKLATFDKRMVVDAVRDGAKTLHLID